MIPVRKTVNQIEPYVPGKKFTGAIKLSSNENPLGMCPKAVAAATSALSDASIYPDGAASLLRETLAKVHGIDADCFVVGNGSDEVMILSAATFLEEGQEAIMGRHTFSQYLFATQLFGGRARLIEMPDGAYPLDGIVNAVSEDTRIVFLCNPNNPTGASYSHDALESLLGTVPDSVLVVEDEAYCEYAETPDYPRSIELAMEYPNLLVLRTFSKIYGMAGLRVGYGIGRPELIADLLRTKQPFNVGSVSQAAATAALGDEEFVRESQRLNREGKAFLYPALDRLGCTYYRTEANFICIDLSLDSSVAAKRLTELGVTVRPLASFGLTTKIRVTVGTREQNELFISCLSQLIHEERT